MRNRFARASQSFGDSPAPFVAVPQIDKLHNCHIYAEDLGQSHAGSLVVGSDSVRVYEPGRFCGFSCVVLDSSDFFNLSSLSSTVFTELKPNA